MTQPNTINSLNTHDILVQYSPVAIAGSGIQQYTRNGQMDIERVHSKKKNVLIPINMNTHFGGFTIESK